LFLNT